MVMGVLNHKDTINYSFSEKNFCVKKKSSTSLDYQKFVGLSEILKILQIFKNVGKVNLT